MSFQLRSIVLTIFILGICRALGGTTSPAPGVPCTIPTFDNVTLLERSCDKADSTTKREWLFWLNYRDEKKNQAL